MKKVCPESGRRAARAFPGLARPGIAVLPPSGSQTCRSSRRSCSRTKRMLRASKWLRPSLRPRSGRTGRTLRKNSGHTFWNIPSHWEPKHLYGMYLPYDGELFNRPTKELNKAIHTNREMKYLTRVPHNYLHLIVFWWQRPKVCMAHFFHL